VRPGLWRIEDADEGDREVDGRGCLLLDGLYDGSATAGDDGVELVVDLARLDVEAMLAHQLSSDVVGFITEINSLARPAKPVRVP
jgi:hypothetical protein